MSTYWSIERNPRGRDFVVGDVHGHLEQLQTQLGALGFEPGVDRLFFLGDIVDRGPDSVSLVEMVDQRTYFSILGNHEAMVIAGFEDSDSVNLHQVNGGAWFYKLAENKQRAIVEKLRSWPWAMEIDAGEKRAGLIHADVPLSNWSIVKKLLNGISETWSRGAPLSDERIAMAAQPLLWQRTLVTRLYKKLLGLGYGKNSMSEYKQAFLDCEHRFKAPGKELDGPFRIEGIDAVYMGHSYVPEATHVGNCNFLDTYRGEPGEALAIQCINAH